mgnify:CR=1 FL=1
MNTNLAEDIYVHRDLYDEREEKNQAIADRNMFEVRGMFAEIRGEIKSLRSDVKNEINEVRGEMKSLNAKIESVDKKIDLKTEALEDSFSMSFLGLEKRLDDMKDYQNKWFSVFGILFGVLTAAFTVIAFFK